MTGNQSMGLFFCGTGTEVGKTYAAAACAAALRRRNLAIGAYKPVASGCAPGGHGQLESNDAVCLRSAIGGRLSLAEICPQRFAASLAPPTAAAAEGASVDEQRMVDGFDRVAEKCEIVVIEGAGGLMSPLSASMTNLDFAKLLGLPVVLVAPNRLGVLNDCLLCWTAITRCTELTLSAIILSSITPHSDPSQLTNRTDLQTWIPGVPVIELAHRGQFDDAAIDCLLGSLGTADARARRS